MTVESESALSLARMHAGGDLGIRGEQAEIGVGERGIWVVVAAADVRVPPHLAVCRAAHHQREFGVRFDAKYADVHVYRVALETRGPTDTLRFGESRLQLHDD